MDVRGRSAGSEKEAEALAQMMVPDDLPQEDVDYDVLAQAVLQTQQLTRRTR